MRTRGRPIAAALLSLTVCVCSICSCDYAPHVPDDALGPPLLAVPSGPQDVPPAQQSALKDLLIGPREQSQLRVRDRALEIDSEDKPLAALLPASEIPEIRQIEGKYLTLFTDLPASLEVNELPAVFDRAVQQWAQYFNVPEEQFRDWQLTGFLMQQPQRFRAAGLFPEHLPTFLHGYHRGRRLWAYDQPSDYYRRHLILHEGVHAFMQSMLGGTGPAWYREGVAELLATHRWQRGRLQVRYMPRNREEVPCWGRVKTIRDEFAASRGLMLQDVLQLKEENFLAVPAYAWSWAAAAFLDGTPSFRSRFRELQRHVQQHGLRFNQHFARQFAGELRELDEQWQLFVVDIDYGYDFARNEVAYAPGQPIPATGSTVSIAVDRGWQSTKLQLQAGRQYRVTAEGRYQIGADEAPWWSEPGGITLKYHRNRPLGMLMGNVRPDNPRSGLANLTSPVPIGSLRQLNSQTTGTLYLRVNDAPNALAENQGEVLVEVMPLDNSPISDSR